MAQLPEEKKEPTPVPSSFVITPSPLTKEEPRLFYQTSVKTEAMILPKALRESAVVEFKVIQGKADVLSIELLGVSQVKSVVGPQLKSWSLRAEGEVRFLDFIFNDPEASVSQATINLTKPLKKIPVDLTLTTFGPGAEAAGFQATYEVNHDEEVSHRIQTAEGLFVMKSDEGSERLTSIERATLITKVTRSAAAPLPVELQDARLVGELFPDGKSASFHLFGNVHVTSETSVSLPILRGRAAPMEVLSTENYRLKFAKGSYQLEFKKPGVYPLDLAFVTPVNSRSVWSSLQFSVPGGTVVPVELKGIPKEVTFDGDLKVMPVWNRGKFRAFLPASGTCHFAWQTKAESDDGKLFFTTEAMDEVMVSAGLIRQSSVLEVKTLQGALESLEVQLVGNGEILAVEGEDLLGWEVDEKRILKISLSRAIEQSAFFTVRSQAPLAKLPLKAMPLQLTPVGAVRHSGFLRLYQSGAVRIEPFELVGFSQLSPEQYPGKADLSDHVKQVFHYRYPAADRALSVAVDRVKPQVNVTQTLSYELTQTDHILRADLELEIREAGIRDWELRVPSDYAVVAVEGAEVVDYILSDPEEEVRRLRVIFNGELRGRRLVKLHLEKNEPAKAGVWSLPSLAFPGSTYVGGELGVSAVPGFRVSPSEVSKVTEMPLARLLNRGPNLQQAFRIKEQGWKAIMKLEALSQNVQADTFHLYSLKEGMAYVSVLVNYFVTGAPVNEWVLSLPEGVKNLDVEGRDIRDYITDEGRLTIPLHQPVMGTYQLLLTYELQAEETLKMDGLVAEGVQSERGFIQVVSPGQVALNEIVAVNSIQELAPLELPAEYQLMTHAPVVKLWQYQRRPFELGAKISWFERGETSQRIVEFADLKTTMARDGGAMTQATYHVRTRGERSLEMTVPGEVQLREVRVNGVAVTIRESGEIRLIPLPENVGPNEPVKVEVRFNSLGTGSKFELKAPVFTGTTQLKTQWEVISDPSQILKPQGAKGVRLVTSTSKANGFDWIMKNGLLSFSLMVALWVVGSWVMKIPAAISVMGVGLVLFAAVGAFYLASLGMAQKVSWPTVLEYRAAVQSGQVDLALSFAQVSPSEELFDKRALIGCGVAILLWAMAWFFVKLRGLFFLVGSAVLTVSLLSQSGGAGWFFLVLGLLILSFLFRGARTCFAHFRAFFKRGYDGPFASSALLMLGLVTAFGLSDAEAAADSLSEVWTIKEGRLSAEVELQVTGKAGEEFPLLRAPGTLTSFQSENLKVLKKEGQYFLTPKAEGSFKASLSYQMRVADLSKGVPLLTGVAAVRQLTVNYETEGWMIDSSAAVRREALRGKGSVARLWLAPQDDVVVMIKPQERDLAAEKTRFYAEVDQLFIPGPGVVDGRHRVRIRPAQGLVRSLELEIPDGFTVSEVVGSAMGPWRFDPESRVLKMEVKPAQSEPFNFQVETQQALKSLPAEFDLSPVRVRKAAGEVGMLALAFGNEAQLDQATPEGLSLLNLGDFRVNLLPLNREKRAMATLQKVYRYGKDPATLKMKVAAVSPEIRVSSQYRLSLGEERVGLAADLTATITRAGVFRLSFPVPDGMEVESLTGESLNHWVEVEQDERRVIVMNLKGKTMGAQKFSVVLSGATPAFPLKSWVVPKISLQESSRQSGQVIVVPGRGIQVKVVQRKDLSALDPRTVGEGQVGALAFRLLQKDWELSLSLDQLAPSLAVQLLQDVELREERSQTRIDLILTVDHASIRSLDFVLPTLSEVDEQTVRASGDEVRDLLKLEGNLWRLRFKRRVLGEVPVRIEYNQNQASESVMVVQVPEARQQESYLALRPGALLELASEKASEWDRSDWVSLPKSLYQADRSKSPAAFLRSTNGTKPVAISLKRHSVVKGVRLRVIQGSLLTLLSTEGETMNQAELTLEAIQQSSMVLTLPNDSQLYGVFVNEESAFVVKDGKSYRFNVSGDAGGKQASVKFTYSTAIPKRGLSGLGLKAFSIGEPLENITWQVALPSGYALDVAEGNLEYNDSSMTPKVDGMVYQALVKQDISTKEKNSMARLNLASHFLKSGDQFKANQTLVQVYNQQNLNAASNEDVRVKVENLATRQAVIGLNTRRQRMYRGNRGVSLQQDQSQLEAATLANPVFNGDLNFGNEDYKNVIQGNDADVNRKISAIANKWIQHQGITAPISQMLDPFILADGEIVSFNRKIQVDGDEILQLELDLENEDEEASWMMRLWLYGLIAVCFLLFVVTKFSPRRRG